MTNEEHNRLIVNVNEALRGRLPEKVRSVSADLSQSKLTLQFIYGGTLDAADKSNLAEIEHRVAAAMPQRSITSIFGRADAPQLYVEQLLPVVILATFEQND